MSSSGNRAGEMPKTFGAGAILGPMFLSHTGVNLTQQACEDEEEARSVAEACDWPGKAWFK